MTSGQGEEQKGLHKKLNLCHLVRGVKQCTMDSQHPCQIKREMCQAKTTATDRFDTATIICRLSPTPVTVIISMTRRVTIHLFDNIKLFFVTCIVLTSNMIVTGNSQLKSRASMGSCYNPVSHSSDQLAA